MQGTRALVDLVDAEAVRSSQPWQLAAEESRVTMGAALAAVDADMFARRWQREAFVRHAQRLGNDARAGADAAIMRRLWARLQGRELRRTVPDATQAWDVIDGSVRSVILDRRDAAKAQLGKDA